MDPSERSTDQPQQAPENESRVSQILAWINRATEIQSHHTLYEQAHLMFMRSAYIRAYIQDPLWDQLLRALHRREMERGVDEETEDKERT
jgi:hypothetical protein